MLTTQVITAGDLAEPPKLAWTPQGLAVVTLTVLVSNGRQDGDEWIPAPPTRHRVKAFGDLAEHAHDSLTTGDRVLVIGSQHVEETPDRATRRQHLTTWVYADEIGPSLRHNLAPPQRPTADPAARTRPGRTSAARGTVIPLVPAA